MPKCSSEKTIKAHTIDIKHDNCNTRRHLERFTRRIKVVSQK